MKRSLSGRRARPGRRTGATLLFALVLWAGGLVSGPTARAAAGGYLDGSIAYSQVVNCPSQISGTPYQEFGMGVYVGGWVDAAQNQPAVGQPFMIHLVASGLGNPCAGQYFLPSFALPAGVSFATDHPIQCYAGGSQVGGADCPQWENVRNYPYDPGYRAYYSTLAAQANLWPMPQGRTWEFQIPVRSDRAFSLDSLRSKVKVIDGNASPELAPSGSMAVFAAPTPKVAYAKLSTLAAPQQPTGDPAAYGLYSEGTVTTHGRSGTALLQLGTASGRYDKDTVRLAITGADPSWRILTDWKEPGLSPLVAGRVYYWRLGWDAGASGGRVVWGQEQKFRALRQRTCAGRPITVSFDLGQRPGSGNDVILGTAVRDQILAGAGDDRVCGGAGHDTVSGGDGNDLLDGQGGNDTVRGDAGADRLTAISGNDTVAGGAGVDSVSYAGNPAAVRVSLATTKRQNTLGAGKDLITGTENLTGGKGKDRLRGNARPNVLDGGPASDVCAGGGGVDTGVSCETVSSIP